MSLPNYFKVHVTHAFIAYSYVYISKALESLQVSPDAEAVIIQPYEAKKFFRAANAALDVYKHLTHSQSIPILFTPRARLSEDGQFFEYGARLIHVLDISAGHTKGLIEQNMKLGKWVLQADDTLYATKNLLVVKSPIALLTEKLPINVAINITHNQGQEVKAVAIPAPKLIKEKYLPVLQSLQ